MEEAARAKVYTLPPARERFGQDYVRGLAQRIKADAVSQKQEKTREARNDAPLLTPEGIMTAAWQQPNTTLPHLPAESPTRKISWQPGMG